MKVFVAGATGVIGTQLAPQLVAAGHDVIAMTRSPAKTDALRALGARPVVADALDPDAVARAVAETEPEVIVAAQGVERRQVRCFCTWHHKA